MKEHEKFSMVKSGGNVTVYVTAMVILSALTSMTVLAIIFLRPQATDNTLYITAVIGVVTPIIGTLIVLLQRENHLTMNSRLDQLLTVSKNTARAEGVLEGAANPTGDAVAGTKTTTTTTKTAIQKD